MTTRVSVIVPVYNPGKYLRPLLESLDRQSMRASEFETVFVDDGSTDGTAAILDEWTGQRLNAVVIHQENHGWPGQPRNVGIDHSNGTYVQFVDQDDWLGDEALARLADYGDANQSDVIIGKMRGLGRAVPVTLFARSHPKAEIGKVPVENSQTPHKMFRRSFLDEISLRFPEGRRRLEDHLFVTTAYLRARIVSVYSDYDCYFHTRRDDGGNSAMIPYEPADYYRNLEEVIDVIDAWLTAGPIKDAFLQRWIRTELVGRLRLRAVADLPRHRRDAFFAEISRVLRDRIPVSAIRVAHPAQRLGAALARSGSVTEFYRLDTATRDSFLTGSRNVDTITVRLHARWRAVASDARVSDLLTRLGAHRTLVSAVANVLGEDASLLPPEATLALPTGLRSRAVRQGSSGMYRIERSTNGVLDGRVNVLTAVGRREALLSRAGRRHQYSMAVRSRTRSVARLMLVRTLGRDATSALISRGRLIWTRIGPRA